ncbi:MAG: DUF2203 domain-containing protein [Acidobacteria bacterium]|nr:DUF2203 domain-containing protein [Acidobacteriota bacterium]
MMSRLFTLHEAEELLPTVGRCLRSAVDNRKNASDLEGEITTWLSRISTSGGVVVDATKFAEMKAGRERAVERLKQALEEIEKSGCLVKDLDIGLVDFPTMFDGEEVYLCWKLGEPNIGFWHHTSEGYKGRKSIDQEFLNRHRGGPTQ